MRVIVADNCGFCVGVKRAVDTAMSVPAENTYVLGEIIHNPDVVKRISERGIVTVETLDEVPDGASLLIRSHGAAREIFESCTRRNIRVIDCTCAFVKRTQDIVAKASAQGKTVAIAGTREHPEVEGLIGWVSGESYVFSSEEDDMST
ncbi:MAG: bifunctional 4-hydroxy-3-methylbut-2-enyl diphosphate reductase/30S ribosomal protein S1, partial [Clostridiales bacterium]|nr:bifunctional 4-hydroxy-3-methylbut-2-enyl diphosphate reductase/30S ribosomal protein S1 [Clostridiales bacterium]